MQPTSDLIDEMLEWAIERAMQRHDKYSDKDLSDSSRSLLRQELVTSFWMAAQDRFVEFK